MEAKRLTPEELEDAFERIEIDNRYPIAARGLRGHVATLEAELACMRLRAMSAEGIANMRRDGPQLGTQEVRDFFTFRLQENGLKLLHERSAGAGPIPE